MRKLVFLILVLFVSPLWAQNMTMLDNAHAFSFKGIDGKELKLSSYAGKVVLVVNTASQCGFTPQYEELQKLYDKYRDRGLVVLGVPSDNFGGQEPGNEDDIKHFTHEKFHITFPLTAKTDVVGNNAHPFYEWASKQDNSGLLGARPRWNFHKFLIGKHGELKSSYLSSVLPLSDTITKDIESALEEK